VARSSGEKRPWREADHPLSSVEFNEVKIYLHFSISLHGMVRGTGTSLTITVAILDI